MVVRAHTCDVIRLSFCQYCKKGGRGDEESFNSDSVNEDAEDEGPTAEDKDPAAGDEGLAVGVECPGTDDESHGLDDESHEELSPALFERYDRDIEELFTRPGALRDEIFSQRYRFRSLEYKQERVAVTFGAIWRPVLALESWASQTDAQRVALWHAISDMQGENQDINRFNSSCRRYTCAIRVG
ncbi:hypothetical protein Tco_1293739 [Tanacetum coccineum]